MEGVFKRMTKEDFLTIVKKNYRNDVINKEALEEWYDALKQYSKEILKQNKNQFHIIGY